jgi:hypothetical protein
MSDLAGRTLNESIERIVASWQVRPGFFELLERD